ncbi:MAG: hypothetical protein IPM56_11620 [Ignavibacteriales bacterium]|nr:MAG: hypothetical protein IPM56_11620 [Ignavibacteriales bacterium]
MLNVNKVQAVQSSHLFNSNILADSAIEQNITGFEEYRPFSLSHRKLSSKAKFNFSIAYFVALTAMIFLLFA